jgi:hypothetical protein
MAQWKIPPDRPALKILSEHAYGSVVVSVVSKKAVPTYFTRRAEDRLVDARKAEICVIVMYRWRNCRMRSSRSIPSDLV